VIGGNASDNRRRHGPSNGARTLIARRISPEHNKRLRGDPGEPPLGSDLSALCQSERILDIHAEIPNSILDLRMACRSAPIGAGVQSQSFDLPTYRCVARRSSWTLSHRLGGLAIWGPGIVGLLVIVLLVLGIAMLAKFLVGGRC